MEYPGELPGLSNASCASLPAFRLAFSSSVMLLPVLLRALFVWNIFEIRSCSHPIAVWTKLRMVSRPLFAQSGKTESTISPRASDTRPNADDTPSYIQLNIAISPVTILDTVASKKDKTDTTTLIAAIMA